MKKILSSIFLIAIINFCINFVYAESLTAKELDKIEKHLYGYTYNNDADSGRLERLEKFVYGEISGGTTESRILKLKKDLNVTDTPDKIAQDSSSQNNKYDYEDDESEYIDSDSSVQYPIVDALEQKISGKTNPKENIYSRVSKLEKQIFKKEEPQKSLNERVDKLKTAIITDTAVAGYDDDGDITISTPFSTNNFPDFAGSTFPNRNNFFNMQTPNILSEGTLHNELAMAERDVLKKTYSSLSVDERISQLEKKVLQRTYPNDDEFERIERVMAAYEAQKYNSTFSGGKFEKNLATGMQIAGFILMILAFVL